MGLNFTTGNMACTSTEEGEILDIHLEGEQPIQTMSIGYVPAKLHPYWADVHSRGTHKKCNKGNGAVNMGKGGIHTGAEQARYASHL